MKLTSITLSIAAATLAMAPSAFAQTPDADQPAASAPPAAASVNDEDVQKYANAIVEVNKIQADTSVAEADKQSKMAEAVEQSGLDTQKFNEITQAAQSDPTVKQRIQAAASASQSQ